MDEHKINDLEKRYFEGLTTDEEEKALRRYLAINDEGHDELRAVMSFLAVGRNENIKRTNKTGHKIKLLTAAATIAALITAGTAIYGITTTGKDKCVAYVNGVKVTNKEMVISQMCSAIKNVSPEQTPEQTVDKQMTDMMNTINGKE